MASSHHAAGGFHPHLPGLKHRFLATGIGATMWLFMFYRIRKDYAPKIFGHPPVEHPVLVNLKATTEEE
ncbi:hypothetical protein DL96DRAFT_1602113 [Flagelloscypha sp. PMI_526]|nr:hypothetical protein DL96DRAFT_1602113 [Flagelloscypha sp. PMI_526]